MIRLLPDSGIRVSELCGLTVEGVDPTRAWHWSAARANKSGRSTSGAAPRGPSTRYLRMRRTQRWAHPDALFLTQCAP